MKFFRKLLRYWIAIASTLSFLGGWVILAHSPKPVQPQAVTVQAATALPALPDLPAIQAYGSDSNNNTLGIPSTNTLPNQSGNSMPRLRTRAS